MKKRLTIISIVLVIVMSLALFTACSGAKLTDDQLTALLGFIEEDYRNGIANSAVTNSSYELPATQRSWTDDGEEVIANIQWTVDTDKITITDGAEGKVKVNIPTTIDADINYVLTATLVNEKGEAYKKEDGTAYSYSVHLKAQKTDVSTAVKLQIKSMFVTAPVAGTAYKLVSYLSANQEVRYFKSIDSGKDYAHKTTTDYAEAADVFVELAGGGFYLYYMNGTTKTYIVHNLYNGSGSTSHQTSTPTTPMTIHATANVPVTSIDGSVVFFGTREQYPDTVRGSLEKFITDDGNAPMGLVASQPQLPAVTTFADTAAILTAAQALGEGETIWGKQTLTGVVTQIISPYSSKYYNGTYLMEVNGVEIKLNNLIGRDIVNLVAVGDTITVTGVIGNWTYDTSKPYSIGFLPTCEVTNRVAGTTAE